MRKFLASAESWGTPPPTWDRPSVTVVQVRVCLVVLALAAVLAVMAAEMWGTAPTRVAGWTWDRQVQAGMSDGNG